MTLHWWFCFIGVALLTLLGFFYLSVLDREFQLPLSSVHCLSNDMCWHKICISKPSPKETVDVVSLCFTTFFHPHLFHAPHLIVVRNRRSPSGGMKWKDWSLALSFMPPVFLTAFGWFLVTDLQVAKSPPFGGSKLASRISICSSLSAHNLWCFGKLLARSPTSTIFKGKQYVLQNLYLGVFGFRKSTVVSSRTIKCIID